MHYISYHFCWVTGVLANHEYLMLTGSTYDVDNAAPVPVLPWEPHVACLHLLEVRMRLRWERATARWPPGCTLRSRGPFLAAMFLLVFWILFWEPWWSRFVGIRGAPRLTEACPRHAWQPQGCCACVGQAVVCRASSLHLSLLRQKSEKNAHRRYTSCAGSQSKSFTWFLCAF